MSKLLLGGHFAYEHLDKNRRLKNFGRVKNGILDAALNQVLETFFRSGTVYTTFFFGLIDLLSFTGINPTDTIASHPGWLEYTGYTEGTRQAWTPGAAAGKTISNPAAAVCTFTEIKTIHGLFIATNNTKGGSSGLLWAAGLFDADQNMTPGETIKLTYNLSSASS